MAAWQDVMRWVLQGVMMPPQVPQTLSQPQGALPLPSLGRFGQQALSLANLPTSTPRRVVTPAQIIRQLPPGSAGGMVPNAEPGVTPTVIEDVFEDLSDRNVPIVSGVDTRIPQGDAPTGPPESGINDAVYNGPAPVTTPITLSPFDPNTGQRVGSDPVTHADGSQSITYPVPDDLPAGVPVEPVYTVPAGATITRNSDILQPGSTVGDFLSPSSSAPEPAAGGGGITDMFTNPFGAAADLLGNAYTNATSGWYENSDYAGINNPWTSSPYDTPLQFVDPYDPYGGSGGDEESTGNIFLDELLRWKRRGEDVGDWFKA